MSCTTAAVTRPMKATDSQPPTDLGDRKALGDSEKGMSSTPIESRSEKNE